MNRYMAVILNFVSILKMAEVQGECRVNHMHLKLELLSFA